MARLTRSQANVRRRRRVRKKVSGDAARPRLSVFRSNRHIYAQLVDDATGRTVAAASDTEAAVDGKGKADKAKAVGALLAKRAKDAGVERAVFDRGGRLYHGRVKALAEGARQEGLQI
jgi:large subunit ribosomal protein L18